MAQDPLDDEPGVLRAYGPLFIPLIIILVVAAGYLLWKYTPPGRPPRNSQPTAQSQIAPPPLGRIAECPRYNPPYAEAPQAKSNADEQRIRLLRRLAWQDDF